MGKIFSYCVSNGTVKMKLKETSQPLSTMHTSDLEKLFPDVEPDFNSMKVVRFCIAIIKGEFRVCAASGIDLFVIIFIYRKQLDIVMESSVLGVAGILILPLAIIR